MEDTVYDKVSEMNETFYSIGYLNMDMRYLSGEITEHVRITKDKYGEASLNLLMLIEVLKSNNQRIQNATFGKAYKICIYIIAKAFKILILIHKLHEDYKIEFEESLSTLGDLIGANPYLMKTAIQNGLDVNWLLTTEIPENITEIHKELRSKGFLK